MKSCGADDERRYLEGLQVLLGHYRDERERAGRGQASDLVVRRELVLDDDPERARLTGVAARTALTRKYAEFNAPDGTPSYQHLQSDAAAAETADQSYLFTDPPGAVAALQALADQGITYVVLRMQWYALPHERPSCASRPTNCWSRSARRSRRRHDVRSSGRNPALPFPGPRPGDRDAARGGARGRAAAADCAQSGRTARAGPGRGWSVRARPGYARRRRRRPAGWARHAAVYAAPASHPDRAGLVPRRRLGHGYPGLLRRLLPDAGRRPGLRGPQRRLPPRAGASIPGGRRGCADRGAVHRGQPPGGRRRRQCGRQPRRNRAAGARRAVDPHPRPVACSVRCSTPTPRGHRTCAMPAWSWARPR